MKKQLKRLPAAGSGASGDLVLAAEGRFVEILVQQITALNNFRMERQVSSRWAKQDGRQGSKPGSSLC